MSISVCATKPLQANTNSLPQAHQGTHKTTTNTEDITDHILASLPASTAPQPFNLSLESNTVSTASRAPRTPSALTPTQSQHSKDLNQDFTPFPRPLPDIISSVFPTELPPRPTSKQSPFKRLFNRIPRSVSTPRSDEDASDERTFRTPDIEMGSLWGSTPAPASMVQQAQADSIRKLKFWLLLVGGWMLCLGIGLLIYAMVRDTKVVGRAID